MIEGIKENRTKSIQISFGLFILGFSLCLWSIFIYVSIVYIFTGMSFILLSFFVERSKVVAWVALIMLCLSLVFLPVYSFFKVDLGSFTLEQFLILFPVTIITFLILYIFSFIKLIKNLKL